MSRHKCTQELYKAFLQATSLRYSGKALSEVSPEPLSHDGISRWLQSRQLRPSGVWEAAEALIPKEEPCLLLADDSVLDKRYSRKIECVQPQYSGNAHQVISGIGLVNLVWRGLVGGDYVPVDFRVYEKAADGKTKTLWGKDPTKRYALYSARHQFAANVKATASQQEVARLLGHHSIRTTRRHYAPRRSAWLKFKQANDMLPKHEQ